METREASRKRIKPFLKWAGNKYQILQHILTLLPPGKRLIEPFVGAGSIFLNSLYPRYLLADSNSDLINLYKLIQDEGIKFIAYAEQYFTPSNNSAITYYAKRKRFNTTKNIREKAALFIYLNKHSFNGLCRYNALGQFNAPFGCHNKPYFPAQEMLAFHCKAKQVNFKQADFKQTLGLAKQGDVVYCDPPYVPLSKTASFTHYNSGGFNLKQQIALATIAERLAARDIPVIISNHATDFILEIYQKAQIYTFEVQRYISCKGNKRSKVTEVLAVFRN